MEGYRCPWIHKSGNNRNNKLVNNAATHNANASRLSIIISIISNRKPRLARIIHSELMLND
jgi:hypothetical protein